MSAALLEARGVEAAFGRQTVLDGVDLRVEPGHLLVVVGPNGAGKSTLVRILSGVLAPRAGTVELRGRAVADRPRREVARLLAVVPPELVVPFGFRVREIVAMGRAPHLGVFGREGPGDRAVVADAIAALGLGPFAERLYPTLSGGEKQRVLLARALAQQADVLALDEPTAHMDLGHRVHAFEWLRGWLSARAEERGVLLVTHDLLLAARFADSLLLMERGRVVAHGKPRDVLTEERIAAVYRVEARVEIDAAGRPVIVALRSRINYSSGADGSGD